MLVNLINEINIQTLDKAIFNLTQKQNYKIKYLIMDSDTLADLKRINSEGICQQPKKSADPSLFCSTFTYKNCVIALCENLSYGVVDIILGEK